MRENLYVRRWEQNSGKHDREAFLPSHQEYRDTLKELYVRVLKFQATSVCYYSKHGALRTGLDVIKWDNWDSLLEEVKNQDLVLCQTYDILNDSRAEERFEAIYEQHRQSLDVMNFISSDLSGLRLAIKETQENEKQQELLQWLSSVDPSKNYNNARSKHKPHTGDWLLKNNDDFEMWKVAPNSLLWLNGKGTNSFLFVLPSADT